MFRLRVSNKTIPQKLSPRKAHLARVAMRRPARVNYSHLRMLRINQTKHRYQDRYSGASALRR